MRERNRLAVLTQPKDVSAGPEGVPGRPSLALRVAGLRRRVNDLSSHRCASGFLRHHRRSGSESVPFDGLCALLESALSRGLGCTPEALGQKCATRRSGTGRGSGFAAAPPLRLAPAALRVTRWCGSSHPGGTGPADGHEPHGQRLGSSVSSASDLSPSSVHTDWPFKAETCLRESPDPPDSKPRPPPLLRPVRWGIHCQVEQHHVVR